MKRQNSSPSNKVAKRQCSEEDKLRDCETKPVLEEAEPFRLVTAKFPIDALTPEWSVGVNRPINESHKRRLCQIFMDQGVHRKELGNRLRVACTKDEVRKMLDHIQPDGDKQEWPCFDDWILVNGTKAELLAGNHRVEALKEYLRRTKSEGKERWWICDLYDKEALPTHLHIKLRANREDPILPDSHGQIWTELAALSEADGTLFQGQHKLVEGQMVRLLGLNGKMKFPARRLVTLWRNHNWRSMTTRWCSISVGRATFNISTFEWMISLRIDDVSEE